MARKKSTPSTFDAFLESTGLSNPETQPEVDNIDKMDTFAEFKPNDDDEPGNEPDQQQAEVNEVVDVDEHDDNSDIPEDVLNNINNQSTDDNLDDGNQEEDDTQLVEQERAQISDFFDAFAESLGWDVDEDNKPNSIDELVQYMGQVVEQNSRPDYADERIQQLDAYVKNGGRFEDFYQNMSQNINYNDMDIEDEANQKTVVRDYLKRSGYSDEQISRKIERYEDADMLYDEAVDAQARLQEISDRELEEQQRHQEEIRQQQAQQQRQFMTDLGNSISGLTAVRGIAIPKEDRKALYDYITRTDSDGLTQYQKDFQKNLVTNLVESAYFTMKGDALLGEAKRNGQTTAANKLRTMLRHQAKNHTRGGVEDEKPRSVADIASRWL